jgi:hypothetical protein
MTILFSIVKIQRWFKSWRQRQFIKTLLSRDLELRKRDLMININEMQKLIKKQEQKMHEKMVNMRIQSERDKEQEEKDAQRRIEK